MDGSRLRDIRKDHGDTQASLGAKLGFSTSMVRKWEQGTSAITVETLKRICRLYNVSADFLLGLSDEDPVFSRKRRETLSEKSRESLRQFEAFLLYQERKSTE